MASRTPGPWATRFIYRMIRRVRESPGDLLIASDPANDWGDAELMAASPNLLAACESALELMRGMNLEHLRVFDQLDAAINRANGVTQ